jgi:hypothetical protein
VVLVPYLCPQKKHCKQGPTKYLVLIFILFLTFPAKGNPNTGRQEIFAVGAHTPPQIDGTIDEADWHFAPGSQLSLAWKNNIDCRIANINRYYLENLRNTL